jgi:hypothetical protein
VWKREQSVWKIDDTIIKMRRFGTIEQDSGDEREKSVWNRESTKFNLSTCGDEKVLLCWKSKVLLY